MYQYDIFNLIRFEIIFLKLNDICKNSKQLKHTFYMLHPGIHFDLTTH